MEILSKRKDILFSIGPIPHIAVIVGCWYITFLNLDIIQSIRDHLRVDKHFWIVSTVAVFLTNPTGILIGKLTKQWRDKIEDAESLANAGKWIGVAERLIVLLLVLQNQYSAIGLLVTAKGLIRFNEKNRPEAKTEYLVIGTLLSIGMAIVTGLLTKV